MQSFCRGCLSIFNDHSELQQYSERYRRLFMYSTGLQVKYNEPLPFQLCKECCINLKQTCKFKKLCRASDRKLKSYMALKEEGDTVIDFGTFLKNDDEMLMLRLPLVNCNSTPVHQKKDDDNESTCTSIRNFMTDILQEENMPDSEARIIREVIEEEANILDDSLDSHWLQDDISVSSEFAMDFNFTPFSTPHSVNNDHCYTPRRLTDEKYANIDFFSGKVNIKKADKTVMQPNDMPTLDDCDIPFNNVIDSNIDLCDIETDFCTENIEEFNIVDNDAEIPLNNYRTDTEVGEKNIVNENPCLDFGTPKKVIESNIEVSNKETIDLLANNISLSDFIAPTANENDICIILNKGKSTNEMFSHKRIDKTSVNQELEFYLHKHEMKKINKTEANDANNKLSRNHEKLEHSVSNTQCTIDRNLELALNNMHNKEFSLDNILFSPSVSKSSGASTPTINNILFGEDLNITKICSTPKHETNFKENNNKTAEQIQDFVSDNIKVKIRIKPIRGKDIRALEKFCKTVPEDNTESDNDLINSENKLVTSIHEKVMSIKKEAPEPKIDNKDLKTENFDVITNLDYDEALLNVEDDQNDLNFSITSDFLKSPEQLDTFANQNVEPVIIHEATVVENHLADPFKKPFSPPDSKYDLDNCYCKICDHKYKTSRALRIHLVKMHKIKIKKTLTQQSVMCDFCGELTKNLQRHLKMHEESKKKHECDVCKLVFETSGRLNLHKRAHNIDTNEKENGKDNNKEKQKFVCGICKKVSTTPYNFKVHQMRHNKDYVHLCEVCNKGFYRITDMQTHMRTHSGERPYSCDFCLAAYTRRSLLMNHISSRHLKYKTFVCELCNKRFGSKYAMLAHEKSKLHRKSIRDQELYFAVNQPSRVKVKENAEVAVKNEDEFEEFDNSNFNEMDIDSEMTT